MKGVLGGCDRCESVARPDLNLFKFQTKVESANGGSACLSMYTYEGLFHKT